MPKPIFKQYEQGQQYLLPPSLDDLIEDNHPVRIVNKVIDKIDIQPLIDKYKGGGTSSHNPKMLLKIICYGYLKNQFSSRKLEEMTKESIHMMWISGMNQPDHNTINRFRSERLKDVLEDIFSQIVLLLVEEDQLSIKEIFVDGTKMEANANRYTFVWGKTVKKNKERIKQQLKELWEYTQKVAEEESREEIDDNFEEIDPEKIQKVVEEIDRKLKGKKIEKKIKQRITRGKREWAKRYAKYQAQEEILDGRNSYSKTDEDATFMRLKEDHMKNSQLKAGYNAQISSNNQYIVNYSIGQNPADSVTLKPHLSSHINKYDELPAAVITDAGYGSEENYQYLSDNQIEGYVKYQSFDREQKKKRVDKKPFTEDKLYYNPDGDYYVCPMGQRMEKVGQRKKTTANNYEIQVSLYQAKNCRGCPLRGVCHNQQEDRIINVSHTGKYFKAKAREKLLSEQGEKYRKERSVDVETIFGNIKQNKNFRRFYLRGKQKVNIEFGLLAITHNLRKYSIDQAIV